MRGVNVLDVSEQYWYNLTGAWEGSMQIKTCKEMSYFDGK